MKTGRPIFRNPEMSKLPLNESLKVSGGAILSYLYNHWLSNCPSRTIRKAYLKTYLAKLGNRTGIQMGVKFLHGRKIYLGNNVVINWGCVLDGRRYPIKVGNNVSIGPDATILTLGHDPKTPYFEDKGGEVVIEDYCWLAYRSTVLPGVTLGKESVVAAGCVISRDTEPFGIYAGAPAKKVGTRPENLSYKVDFDPWLI